MIYKTRKRYRGEPICADPTADPHENETALHFTAGDRRLWISSYEPTVVAGLLAHPDFQIGHLVLMKADGRECVVGVVGKLPVGALSLGRARKSDSHELVVPGKSRLPVVPVAEPKEASVTNRPRKRASPTKDQLELPLKQVKQVKQKRRQSSGKRTPKKRTGARSNSRKLSTKAKQPHKKRRRMRKK